MSFREKIAWACLVTTVVTFAPYFGFVFWLALREEFRPAVVMVAFVAAVVVQVVLLSAAAIAIAIRSRHESQVKDERDVYIEAKSIKYGYTVFAVLCWLVVGGTVFTFGMFARSPDQWLGIVMASQLVLLCFVIAEVIRFLTLAICYRRGC